MLHQISCKRVGRSSNKGFTLIELLVVIAIIAILAAILFPIFARARENARRSSCQSNLKQLGLGVMQYVQDYDERYPMAWRGAYAAPTATIKDDLVPYLKSEQIWICPSFRRSQWLSRTDRNYDYGYHGNLLGLSGIDAKAFAALASQIPSPSTQIMMGDMFGGVFTTSGGSADWVIDNRTNTLVAGQPDNWVEWNSPTANAPHLAFPTEISGPENNWGPFTSRVIGYQHGNTLAPRHLGTANVLYVDGHVKTRNVEDVWSKGCGNPASEWCNGL